MPYFKITTNREVNAKTRKWLFYAMRQLVIDELGKPSNYIMTAIDGGIPMQFADSEDHLAFVEFKSIGLPDTKKLSEAICNLIEGELNIPSQRVYIEFTDEPRNMFGHNKTTFE